MDALLEESILSEKNRAKNLHLVTHMQNPLNSTKRMHRVAKIKLGSLCPFQLFSKFTSKIPSQLLTCVWYDPNLQTLAAMTRTLCPCVPTMYVFLGLLMVCYFWKISYSMTLEQSCIC